MPKTNQDQEIVVTAQEIYDYLSTHPNAVDSLEGVVKWWLTRQRLESATDLVQKALDYLVAEGMVSKKLIANGKIVYVSCETPKNDIRNR